MEVFDHGGHTGVRMVVIVYVADKTALDFLNSIHKVSLPKVYSICIQYRHILAGVGLKPCMHVLSIEVMKF